MIYAISEMLTRQNNSLLFILSRHKIGTLESPRNYVLGLFFFTPPSQIFQYILRVRPW